MTHREPDKHLKPTKDGKTIINLEDFCTDWIEAKDKYFQAVEDDPDLWKKFIKRYERDGFLGLVKIELA